MNYIQESAARLREQRAKSGLSRRELADSVSKTESAIGNYEQGLRGIPVDTARLIADKLNCSAAYLLCLDEYDTSKGSPTRSKVVELLGAMTEEELSGVLSTYELISKIGVQK